MRTAVLIMGILFVTGMLIWIGLFRVCQGFYEDIREGTMELHIIRKIVGRYDDCRKLNININNVHAFVEKMIDNERFFGLRIRQWQRIAGIIKYIIVLAGVVISIILRENTDVAYVCIAVGVMCAVALQCMDILADCEGFIGDTVVEIEDYLENGRVVRNTQNNIISGRLTGKAAVEFSRLSRQYDKLDKLCTFKTKNIQHNRY